MMYAVSCCFLCGCCVCVYACMCVFVAVGTTASRCPLTWCMCFCVAVVCMLYVCFFFFFVPPNAFGGRLILCVRVCDVVV